MTLAGGEKLGPYKILSRIGAGGMGEVYLAHDPRVGRDVAIKVSKEQFSERFEREARVVASLNHPNICHLYDVGPNYLVMELVEGKSPKGPMPLDEAWQIGSQIAAALAYAHEKGIIHRDLKPANVKITPGGVVKLLDFGLAKAFSEPVAESAKNMSNSPTLTMATEVGVILGTAAYMAPEQAKGKNVDQRADIWAFGALVYELLTGHPLFQGEDVSETLAQVLTRQPDWKLVPAKAKRLLQECLQKDPRLRLRDIGDARLLLDESAPLQSSRRSSRWKVAAVIAALMTIAVVALAFIHFREMPPPADLVQFEISAPDKGHFATAPYVSPNGRRLAFAGSDADGRIVVWVHDLSGLETRVLSGVDPANPHLVWSPDSRTLAFNDASSLKKVDASGGRPTKICDFPGAFRGAAWNRDGVILIGTTAGLFQVSQEGGMPILLAELNRDKPEDSIAEPVFLPDRHHFLYYRSTTVADRVGIYIGSLDQKPEEQLTRRAISGRSPGYLPSPDGKSGYVLFLREGALMAQRFDEGNLELVGEAMSLADDVGNSGTQGFFTVSTTGVLAFRTGRNDGDRQYTWYDRLGNNLGVALGSGFYDNLTLSRDGTHAAGDRGQSNRDIWLLDLASSVSNQFTFDPGNEMAPVFSPDGSQVAFISDRDGGRDIYQKVASGAGSEMLLYKSPYSKVTKDWSRDGRFLLFQSINPKTGGDLLALPMTGEDRKPILIVETDAREDQGQFSPDSHWVAYTSDAGGQNNIWVQPFPSTADGGKWKISTNGGTQPRWNRNGNELFYISPNSKLMSVQVSTAGGIFKHNAPQPLFDAQTYAGGRSSGAMRWDVSPDGTKFLMITGVAQATTSPVKVVINWPALLKR